MIGHIELLAAACAAYPDAGDATILDVPGTRYEVGAEVGGVLRATGAGATTDEARAALALALWTTAARAACVRVATALRTTRREDVASWDALATPTDLGACDVAAWLLCMRHEGPAAHALDHLRSLLGAVARERW